MKASDDYYTSMNNSGLKTRLSVFGIYCVAGFEYFGISSFVSNFASTPTLLALLLAILALALLYFDLKNNPDLRGLEVFSVGYWYKTSRVRLWNIAASFLIAVIGLMATFSVFLHLQNLYRVKDFTTYGVVETGQVVSIHRGHGSGSSELVYKSPTGEIQTFHITAGYLTSPGESMKIAFPLGHREKMVPVDFELESGIPFPVAFLILAVILQLPAWYLLKLRLLADQTDEIDF